MTALMRTGRCPPELIDAARCGDEKALLSLISAAQPDVRRYAARNCRVADIDDAVQETLLLLYRRIGTLRAVTSFSAWLFAVARRACHRLLRMSIGIPDDPLDAVEARLAHLRPEDIRIDLSRAIQPRAGAGVAGRVSIVAPAPDLFRSWPAVVGMDLSKGIFAEFL